MRKALLSLLVFTSAPVFSITYTDWDSATLSGPSTPGSASGTLGALTVTYSGNLQTPTQVNDATTPPGGVVQYYWNPSTPFLNSVVTSVPASTDIIALSGGQKNTITFSQPVIDPVLLIVSLGNESEGRYVFDQPFTLLSSGLGYFGEVDGPTLTAIDPVTLGGIEGHGAIQFKGSISSISFSASEEFWSGFTVGVPTPDALGFAPSCVAIIGCLAVARWRKQ